MRSIGDMAAWAALGTSAFAALLVALALVLLVRLRRLSNRRLEAVQESTSRTAELVAELTQALKPVEGKSEAGRGQDERDDRERQHLGVLSELATILDLEETARRALEHAVADIGADGASAILHRDGAEPFKSSFGLSRAESERELVGFSLDAKETRAVTIRYRYGPEEAENDAFRLTWGLAVPLDAEGTRIGTLAVFWRRSAREPGDGQVVRLEQLAGSLAGPLRNAQRFEAARRLADIEPLTGLHTEHYLADRLVHEVARARRYERRLALLFFRFPVSSTPAGVSLLGTVGHRIRAAVRSADVACHLGEGRFAVILPEVGVGEADHLYRRLRFGVGSRMTGTTERAELPGTAVELKADDDEVSLLQRAEEVLRAAPDEPKAAAEPRG